MERSDRKRSMGASERNGINAKKTRMDVKTVIVIAGPQFRVWNEDDETIGINCYIVCDGDQMYVMNQMYVTPEGETFEKDRVIIIVKGSLQQGKSVGGLASIKVDKEAKIFTCSKKVDVDDRMLEDFMDVPTKCIAELNGLPTYMRVSVVVKIEKVDEVKQTKTGPIRRIHCSSIEETHSVILTLFQNEATEFDYEEGQMVKFRDVVVGYWRNQVQLTTSPLTQMKIHEVEREEKYVEIIGKNETEIFTMTGRVYTFSAEHDIDLEVGRHVKILLKGDEIVNVLDWDAQ